MNSVLITGGTGSFGKQFIASLFERHPEIKRVVVFSRDELKQFQMSQSYPSNRYPAIRFFIGDIHDQARIRRASQGIDTVIHAAPLKHVPIAGYNFFRVHQDQRSLCSESHRGLPRYRCAAGNSAPHLI